MSEKRTTIKPHPAAKRIRRTRLYIPGNNPAMIQNAEIYGADSLIFDLEDSISIAEKDSARVLVKNALKKLDFGSCEKTVRINSRDTEYFMDDLQAIIPAGIDGILLPKTENLEDIQETNKIITKIELENNLTLGKVAIMPLIETARGVLNIGEIVTGPRVAAVGLGGEDLTSDLGAKRTKSGKELEYIASKVILACAAYKIQVIDTVYADVNDTEGLYEVAKQAMELGFHGKSIIHPSQVEPVHRAFMPTPEEITKAEKVIQAYREAKEKGKGAVAVDGRMVDLPVVRRSEQILQRAKAGGAEISVSLE